MVPSRSGVRKAPAAWQRWSLAVCAAAARAGVLVAASSANAAGSQGLGPQCAAYLERHGFADPQALAATLQTCVADPNAKAAYAPEPKSSMPGVTDTTPLSCKYGHPSYLGPTGGTCCGWKPHFNWVVGTCEENDAQQDSMFCRNLPACVRDKGENGCGPKINYMAGYQYNGSHFVLVDESSAGLLTDSGISGSFEDGTGWEQKKDEFRWKSGDWTSKYAPWGDGPKGPRGLTPPAMMWVLSADSFYYGALYMLSQLTLNLEGNGNPTGTNCWAWELDVAEGTRGWFPDGHPLPGNLNHLYATNNAAVSGCMPVTYLASQAQGLKREFSQPEQFREYCANNPTAAGCQPWVNDVMWSGGVGGTQRFENYADQQYVFAVVVNHRGYWIYRWIPDQEGRTGWPGIGRRSAARVLDRRPKAVTDTRGLETDIRGDVPEAVILQPSVPPEASCLRASIEAPNFQFGADALGAMATELGKDNSEATSGPLDGAQNWWAHFADTEQYQNYPMSIAGVPLNSLSSEYSCNVEGSMGCKCMVQVDPPYQAFRR